MRELLKIENKEQRMARQFFNEGKSELFGILADILEHLQVGVGLTLSELNSAISQLQGRKKLRRNNSSTRVRSQHARSHSSFLDRNPSMQSVALARLSLAPIGEELVSVEEANSPHLS